MFSHSFAKHSCIAAVSLARTDCLVGWLRSAYRNVLILLQFEIVCNLSDADANVDATRRVLFLFVSFPLCCFCMFAAAAAPLLRLLLLLLLFAAPVCCLLRHVAAVSLVCRWLIAVVLGWSVFIVCIDELLSLGGGFWAIYLFFIVEQSSGTIYIYICTYVFE